MRYFLSFLLMLCVTSAIAQHDDIKATNEFKVTGLVKNQLTLNTQSLLAFKQDTLEQAKINSSHGTEQDRTMRMKGVKVKAILDSAHITAPDHKAYGELYILLTASDGYKSVYSWNELFNTEVGEHVYIITEMDGEPIDKMKDRVLVMSLSDIHSGRRHLKALSSINVRRVQ